MGKKFLYFRCFPSSLVMHSLWSISLDIEWHDLAVYSLVNYTDTALLLAIQVHTSATANV
eukprot:6009074-Amphidinium_carterae.1